ncbi:unnamed protein product, partial [marine sediment metagenome]
ELVSGRLRSLILSAVDFRGMRVQEGGFFPEEFISDYIKFLENFIIMAEAIDGEILQKLEEISTDFVDKTIPFVSNNKLIEDNPNFTYDLINKLLNVAGRISSEGRIKNKTSVDTTPYSVVESDEIINCDTDSGVIDLYLLPGIGSSDIKINNTGSSGNDVNVIPNSTELLYGENLPEKLYDSEGIIIGYNEPEGWW